MKNKPDILLTRYRESLQALPAPGDGCHPALLSVANLGILSGKTPQKIHNDLRQFIPRGKRQILGKEISDTINKALTDHNGTTYTRRVRPVPIVNEGKTALQKIIAQGKISNDADLWEASPIRLWNETKNDQTTLLQTCFHPADKVWIGDRHKTGIMGDTVRTAGEWIAHFRGGGTSGPFIITNPLNGIPAPTKSGDKTTLRGDGNIASYRYAMAEFDNLSRDDQIRFWSAIRLPVIALIDTGGKSIHAWLEVSKLAQVDTSEQWMTHIKGRLYDRILTPMGIDAACSNPARLSRLPGHFRTEKKAYQRILWLSPEGKPICP